jgi:hypothetical protein
VTAIRPPVPHPGVATDDVVVARTAEEPIRVSVIDDEVVVVATPDQVRLRAAVDVVATVATPNLVPSLPAVENVPVLVADEKIFEARAGRILDPFEAVLPLSARALGREPYDARLGASL